MESILALLLTLAYIAAFILLGFALWRLILWNSYARIGWRPLRLAYLLFLVALLVSTSVQAIFAASASPFVLLLYVYAIPLSFLTFVGVPIAALLLRFNRVGYEVAASVVLLIGAFMILDPYPFWESLLYLVPSSGAFFIGLFVSARRRREEHTLSAQRETSAQS